MNFSLRKPAWPVSLSARLLLTTAIALVLASIATVSAITFLLRPESEVLVNMELEDDAEEIAEGLRFDAHGMPDRMKIDYKMQTAYDVLKLDAGYRVLDRAGAVLLSSAQPGQAYALDGRPFDPALRRFKLVNSGEVQQVFTMPFEHDGRRFYVQTMRSERMHKVMLGVNSKKAKRIVLKSFAVAMLLFSLVVVVTLHRMLKPLRKAAAVTGRIQPDNLSTRLSLDGIPDELAPLFNAFNLVLQRLDDGYRIQREFLATAAHELKTPLALIRGQIELEYANRGHDCGGLLQDLDHMARQVHQLLHLAEASERQNYAMEQTDVMQVATEAIVRLERLAQRLDVKVVLKSVSDNPAIIEADSGALFVLLRNLIENALHHAPAGSTVEVDASSAGVAVRDYGKGIPEDAMPHLFQRFWRGPHRRDEGAGLGLSICDEIVRAHGWTLGAHNAQPGAIFTVGFSKSTRSTG